MNNTNIGSWASYSWWVAVCYCDPRGIGIISSQLQDKCLNCGQVFTAPPMSTRPPCFCVSRETWSTSPRTKIDSPHKKPLDSLKTRA